VDHGSLTREVVFSVLQEEMEKGLVSFARPLSCSEVWVIHSTYST
jgi:hypothetical protein